MAADQITITPPTIRLTMKMPRLYGLRLLVASWFIAAADRLAGGALEVVMTTDEIDELMPTGDVLTTEDDVREWVDRLGDQSTENETPAEAGGLGDRSHE